MHNGPNYGHCLNIEFREMWTAYWPNISKTRGRRKKNGLARPKVMCVCKYGCVLSEIGLRARLLGKERKSSVWSSQKHRMPLPARHGSRLRQNAAAAQWIGDSTGSWLHWLVNGPQPVLQTSIWRLCCPRCSPSTKMKSLLDLELPLIPSILWPIFSLPGLVLHWPRRPSFYAFHSRHFVVAFAAARQLNVGEFYRGGKARSSTRAKYANFVQTTSISGDNITCFLLLKIPK